MDLDKYLDRTPQLGHCNIDKLDNLEKRGKWDAVHAAYKEIMSLVPEDGDRVVDVGCGGGWALKQLEKTHKSVTGVTLSSADAEELRVHCNKILICDMHKMLDFTDGIIDGIFASHVLEHSPAPYVALMEFNRILKNDGWLMLVMPERDGVAGSEKFRRIGFFGTHIFCADPSTIIYLLRRTGFRLEWYREIPGYNPQFTEPYIYHQVYLARKGRGCPAIGK